jgi:hypothetical protein
MATGALTTGKIAEVIFTETLDTFETQDMLLNKVSLFTPDASMMQNAGNTIWRTVRQHRPIISGWDLTGLETGIIQQTYPAVLGTPYNDFISQRADDMRDMQFWKDAGREGGLKQASYLNTQIANTIALQGSLFIRSNASSGYNFIAAQQALMNERQLPKGERYSLLNDRDTLTFASDLAARQTLQGRPATTWDTGQIGANVAEFDVYTGSFLPNLTGGASPNTTVTGNQSFAPTAGTVNSTTLVVTNVDYRSAVIPVAASASYNVGDKVRFQNPNNVDVEAIGLDTKVTTGEPMTFTVISKPDGTSLEIFPRPIAVDDGALSSLQQAYANINTTILNGALVVRLNVDASVKTDLLWDKKAVEVLGGTIPAQLFKEFGGKKVVSATMKNGLTMYMVYDGNITDMTFRYRLFVWYGITMRDPSAAGVAVRYTAT